MGTDVHAVFQKRVSNGWIDVPSEFKEDRHYFLFAWLADVRNGVGFAGVLTHAPVKPIAKPRGYPADFKVEKDMYGEKYMGYHDQSWLTAAEILAAQSPNRVWRTGVITVEAFAAWDGHTPPEEWSGGVVGRDVVVAASPVAVDSESTHVQIYWLQQSDDLKYFTDEVAALKEKHGEVRMVFGFDS